jgi:hypothetical protein
MFCGICLASLACSSHAKEHSQSSLAISVSAPNDIGDTLTTVYTQAISAFITVAQQKEGVRFDTLFFGKHVYGQPDDFPDIELPQIIEQTQIRLIAPEAGLIKQKAQKDLVYVNMVGWVEKSQAEFIFVVFSNGAAHQYDYFISFDYKTSVNKFELVKIEFENHQQLNGQKPKRHTIFKDGKYVEDK